MPHVVVKDVMTHLNSSESSASVTIEEVAKEASTEQVYKP